MQKALGKGSQAALLAPLLYARDGLAGLESLPADWLAANAREALAFIADKPKGRHKIRVRRMPAGGKGALPEGSVVEILNDDMPFLVDSVLGELQARGLAVRFLFHPIFKTQRDKAGRLQTIAGAGDEKWSDGHQESYIAIHLRALPDTEARDLAATISDILAEVRVVVADWSPMLQRLETATRQLETAPASRRGGPAARDDGLSRSGSSRPTSPSSARASSSSRATPTPATSRRWTAAASASCATRKCRCCAAAASWWR